MKIKYKIYLFIYKNNSIVNIIFKLYNSNLTINNSYNLNMIQKK